jgi:hypothetical protein
MGVLEIFPLGDYAQQHRETITVSSARHVSINFDGVAADAVDALIERALRLTTALYAEGADEADNVISFPSRAGMR